MNEMDDLLAQLKAEYTQSEESSPSPSAKPLPQPQNKSLNQPTQPLDNLLAEVKAEFEPSSIKSKQPNKINYDNSVAQSSHSAQSYALDNPSSSFKDNLIQDLQQEYQAKEKAEQERKQEELLARSQQQQLRERRRKAILKQKAQEWLKNLNPNSDEGLWFEEFAYSYESKLEAAMDYLAAIQESRRLG